MSNKRRVRKTETLLKIVILKHVLWVIQNDVLQAYYDITTEIWDWWKLNYFHIMLLGEVYRVCSKTNKTQAIFTKTELSNEGNANFLQNSPLGSTHISASLPLIIAPQKLFSWCGVKVRCLLRPQILYLKWIFSLRNKKTCLQFSLVTLCSIQYFTKNNLFKKLWNWLYTFFFFQMGTDFSELHQFII